MVINTKFLNWHWINSERLINEMIYRLLKNLSAGSGRTSEKMIFDGLHAFGRLASNRFVIAGFDLWHSSRSSLWKHLPEIYCQSILNAFRKPQVFKLIYFSVQFSSRISHLKLWSARWPQSVFLGEDFWVTFTKYFSKESDYLLGNMYRTFLLIQALIMIGWVWYGKSRLC